MIVVSLKPLIVVIVVSFGLNIENSFLPIPCRSINFTGGQKFLVFFDILVNQGTALTRDFSDMTHTFLYSLYCLFTYYQFVDLCNLFFLYMLLFYNMFIFVLFKFAYFSNKSLSISTSDDICNRFTFWKPDNIINENTKPSALPIMLKF